MAEAQKPTKAPGRGRVYDSITDTIGDTPLVRLNRVAAGTQIGSVTPAAHWIIANFKETQMDGMRPGLPATFTVDALGGLRLKGHVVGKLVTFDLNIRGDRVRGLVNHTNVEFRRSDWVDQLASR